jgi:hypothetical protein
MIRRCRVKSTEPQCHGEFVVNATIARRNVRLGRRKAAFQRIFHDGIRTARSMRYSLAQAKEPVGYALLHLCMGIIIICRAVILWAFLWHGGGINEAILFALW